MHPLWLVPFFLLGTWYGPLSRSTDEILPNPVYKEEAFDYDKAFLPPDAPPLAFSDDEAGGGSRSSSGSLNERSLQFPLAAGQSRDDLGWSSLTPIPRAPPYLAELDGYIYYPPQAPLVPVKIPVSRRTHNNNPFLAKYAAQKAGGAAAAKQDDPGFPLWPAGNEQHDAAFKPSTGDDLKPFLADTTYRQVNDPKIKNQNAKPAVQKYPGRAPIKVERDERGHVLGANAAAARKAVKEGIPFKPKKPADMVVEEAKRAAAKRRAMEEEAKRKVAADRGAQGGKVAPGGPAKLGFGAGNPQVNARKEAAARAEAMERLRGSAPKDEDVRMLKGIGAAGSDDDDLYEDDEETEQDDDWENDLVLPAQLTEFERSFLSKEDLAVVDEYEADIARKRKDRVLAKGAAAAAAPVPPPPKAKQVRPNKAAPKAPQKPNPNLARQANERHQAEVDALKQARKIEAEIAEKRKKNKGNRWKRSFDVDEPEPIAPEVEKIELETSTTESALPSTTSTNVQSIETLLAAPDTTTSTSPESPTQPAPAERMVQHRKRAVPPEPDAASEKADASQGSPGRLHPISWLIKTAEARWKEMVSRQSQTLEDAVREYERRYKRKPPLGFDKWWKYAMGNRIVLVDEYDQIMQDIEPFLALSSAELKQRLMTLTSDPNHPSYPHSFTVSIKDGIVSAQGAMRSSNKAEDTLDLMSEFSDMLPDMKIVMAGHEGGSILVSGEAREKHIAAAKAGRTLERKEAWSTFENNAFDPFVSLCDTDSPARQRAKGTDAGVSPLLPSFVSIAHALAMDYCKHPEIQKLNGYTAWRGARSHLLYPRFATSKLASQSDILSVPLDNYFVDVGPVDIWKRKWSNKVLWRGRSSGTFRQAGRGWRSSHRDRLVALTTDTNGTRAVRIADKRAGDAVRRFEGSTKDINDFYFDVAFLGPVSQCSETDGSCEALVREYRFDTTLPKAMSNSYKYVIDVDDNGWSSDFRRLMQTGSLVMKSTVFPEWWSKRIMPWYHYVPIKQDYSDLHDVAAYFIGAPDGSCSHDEVAEQIASNGKAWARDHWREVDLAAYQFRLLLEYARLLNRNEKESYDFVL